LCYLSFQADGEWTSVPRCPDQQDVAFSDLDNQLTVSTALAKVISTTVVHYSFSMAGSDRQSDSVYIVHQYPNAFEHLVSRTQYSAGVDITIGPYAVYSELLPFEIVIGGPSFEIKGQSVRPLTLYLTITVDSVAAVSGWSFEKPPVSATSNISAYATGLCQSPWSGVTCLKGEVVGLNLKGSE